MRALPGFAPGSCAGPGWLAVAAFLLLLPAVATAGSVTVAPTRLSAEDSVNGRKSLNAVWAAGGRVRFWAPVKLPVGARIRKLGHWYWRIGTCSQFATRLYRFRLDAGREQIAWVGVTQSTNMDSNSAAAWDETTNVVTEREMVRPGYKYFVEVDVPAADYCLGGGVKIFFR